jgi:hypothetical protein
MQTRVGGLAIFDKYVPVYTTTFGGPFPPSLRGDFDAVFGLLSVGHHKLLSIICPGKEAYLRGWESPL